MDMQAVWQTWVMKSMKWKSTFTKQDVYSALESVAVSIANE